MLSIAVARYLDSLDLVDLDEVGEAGDCFIEQMPAAPDEAVAVMSTGGLPQLTHAPTDLPTIQVRVRGRKHDPRAGWARAQAIYGALACLDGVLLDEGGPDEVWVIGCTPAQSAPVPIGADENSRHEWSINAQFRTHNPTVHRPPVTI